MNTIRFNPFTGQALIDNSFCPTGEGGGVDPTCSPTGEAALSKELELVDQKISRMSKSIPVGALTVSPSQADDWNSLHKRKWELHRKIQDASKPRREAEKAIADKIAAEKLHARMDVDAKRVSELPVFQRHNGWEVVKDDLHYVVRNPHTKEEVYRGNTLKRAKEVAKEGDPPLE